MALPGKQRLFHRGLAMTTHPLPRSGGVANEHGFTCVPDGNSWWTGALSTQLYHFGKPGFPPTAQLSLRHHTKRVTKMERRLRAHITIQTQCDTVHHRNAQQYCLNPAGWMMATGRYTASNMSGTVRWATGIEGKYYGGQLALQRRFCIAG